MRRLFIVLILILAPVGAAFYAVRADRYRAFQAPVFVDIPRGTSTLTIGEMLTDAGVVRHPLVFALARLMRSSGRAQAGEYHFEQAATPAEVFERLARGDVYQIEVRVPEGSDVFDIARLVQAAGLATSAQFLRVARSQEGHLFPATYFFRRRANAETVCRTMRAQFDKVWHELGGPASDEERTLIIASLVETEARLDEERPRIAAVYLNRLRLKMPLEADPTVAYAAKLDGRWTGVIRRDDLDNRHAYNTYRHAGLPPGPVANPGRASIEAALHPAESKEMYFVARADHSGGHVFSENYEAHQRAVAAYRHAQHTSQPSPAGPHVAAHARRAAR
jgi:UPF0755 protein